MLRSCRRSAPTHKGYRVPTNETGGTDIETTAQVLGGRIGAYRKWARCTDRAAAVAASHASFNARFEREVDPEGVLSELERAQRAQAARSAHFAAMALKRHQSRMKKGRTK